MSLDEKVTSIILAGGQGTRLYPLTRHRSKPAVPIGGKFRLIDIPISNCLHADIRNIWIVTQFASESIHRHIFSTYRMDPFDKGFISILAASQTAENKGWYQGTADAVRQNLRFFESAHINMMILSGDHLYRMDYRKFLKFHLENDADISISVIPMSEERVPELGILKIDKDNLIVDFVEKPNDKSIIKDFAIPASVKKDLQEKLGVTKDKTHFASMGIYLFKKDVLFNLLRNCDHEDFGKQIIPENINKLKIFAYPFHGYWEDIGTIKSFFDAQIALTKIVPEFNFFDEDKPIFSHPRFLPAAKFNSAQVESSVISEGSIIDRSFIRDSVIGVRSIIRNNCVIEKVVMMGADYYENEETKAQNKNNPSLGIGENSVIKNAIVDKNVRIGRNVHLVNKNCVQNGEFGDIIIKDGIIVISKGTVVEDDFLL